VEKLQESLDSQYNKARVSVTNQPVKTPLDIQRVDDDPSWDLAAISAGSQFAPAAVSAGQPLTVYVKGRSIVGIEVTDPTRALQLQVQSLRQQITNLQSQLTNAQAQTAKDQAPGKA
jgi:hypothetical protein